MLCEKCGTVARKHCKDFDGNQRYHCVGCVWTFVDRSSLPSWARQTGIDNAEHCLRLVLEGVSVRAVERITGVHRDTIISLVVTVGEQCQSFLELAVCGVAIHGIQCDEISGFVGCKGKAGQRTRQGEGNGGAYCLTAIESKTKLLLAWHLGKRSSIDSLIFSEKLDKAAVGGRFQVTAGGYKPRREIAHHWCLAWAIRDAPGQNAGECGASVTGAPNQGLAYTSMVERSNLTWRMHIRQMARLTKAFSKKWENHAAALALFFAYYNFCRKHSALKATPAVAAGIAETPWSLRELLTKAAAA